MTTPLEIDIALWYNCRVGDYGAGNGDNNFDAPAVQSALDRMADAGLLRRRGIEEPGNAVYAGGPALSVYVEALRAVPWPVQKWVIPQSSIDISELYVR